MDATITLYVNDNDNEVIIAEREALSMFRDYVDETHDNVEIFGMTFSPSAVLATDEIAEHEMFLNWLGSEWQTFENIPFHVYCEMTGHEIEEGPYGPRLHIYTDDPDTDYGYQYECF